jgi:hypothetical protein
MLCRRKPPSLPRTTPSQRAADAYLRVAEAYGGWPHVAVIVALFILAGFLPARGELGADAAAFAWAGVYCLANFWRCREPHCVITGIGWGLLLAFTIAELILGHSLIGGTEPLVFLGILLLAWAFETAWRAKTGSYALRRRPADDTHPESGAQR